MRARPSCDGAAEMLAATAPPGPITPMKANCEPPVNISALSAQACQTSSPAVTARAPKDTPYTPTAAAIDSPIRTAGVKRDVSGTVSEGIAAG